jgi:NADH-quinone oxidoreductase subunit L
LASAFARGDHAIVFRIAWGLGLAAALMTAYYMARLMSMTFLGQFRGGEAARKHLHEAPAIMTVPLAILGMLTVIGGVINLPAVVGGGSKLEHWLEPVLAPANALLDPLHLPHGTTEYLLLGGAILIALVGLSFGFQRTAAKQISSPADTPAPVGLARWLEGKYFIDELYQKVFVTPLMWFSTTVLWKGFDQFIVDKMGVAGTARVSQGLGWLGSRLQNGQVALYVSMFVVGVILILRELVGG